jgi:hypothetical protein
MLNSLIREAIYIAKTSCFITVPIPLTAKTINWFRLVKPIDQSIPGNF